MRTHWILLAMLALSCSPTEPQSSPTSVPIASATTAAPNVLLILTDDQRYDDLAVMPKTQARLTTVFAAAYSTTSWCGPARTSLLSGQYVHNHGVHDNNGSWEKMHNNGTEANTVAVWLHNSGYSTALFGKYINSFGDFNTFVPPGWDEFYLPKPDSYFPKDVMRNGVRLRIPATYATTLVTTKALAWMTERTQAGQPWFAYLAIKAPHDPFVPAPEYAGTLGAVAPPRPPSFNVPTGFPSLRPYPLSPDSVAAFDAEYRARLETLLSVDDAVAKMVDSLGALGVLENTLILFASDNGYMVGEHAQTWKNLTYEESTHLPMLARAPGAVAGTRSQLVALIDIAPTIADYAGVTVPLSVDGRSLRPVLGNPAAPGRQSLLIEHWRNNVTARGLRTSRWAFTEWWLQGTAAREVFDMNADPFQIQNLKHPGDTAYNWMRDLTKVLATCKGAACRTLENAPVP